MTETFEPVPPEKLLLWRCKRGGVMILGEADEGGVIYTGFDKIQKEGV